MTLRRARRSTREAPYTRARRTAAITTTCQATDQTVAQTVLVTWATTWWAAVLAELAAEDAAAAGCPPVAVAAFQPRRKARTTQTAVTGPAYLGVSLTVTRCAQIEPNGVIAAMCARYVQLDFDHRATRAVCLQDAVSECRRRPGVASVAHITEHD